MGKVRMGSSRKKPTVMNVPFIKIGRFLKKYRPAASKGDLRRYPPYSGIDPKYLPMLSIFPNKVERPPGYLPPVCEERIELAVYQCRALQLLKFAKNPAKYNIKGRPLARKAN